MANGREGGRRNLSALRGPHPRTAQQFQKDSIGITVLSDVSQALKRLEKGVLEKVLRSGARAGALVFYNEIRLRVPFKSGKLYESIYHWHDDKKSTAKRQTYAIGPNKQKAPHWHWLEYGNIHTAAKPYIRPSYTGKQAAALAAVNARMSVRMKELLAEIGS